MLAGLYIGGSPTLLAAKGAFAWIKRAIRAEAAATESFLSYFPCSDLAILELEQLVIIVKISHLIEALMRAAQAHFLYFGDVL